jgi:hypothetical protein
MSLYLYSESYTDALGRPVTSANVAVLVQSAIGTPATGISIFPGGPLATLYQDAAGAIPLWNPFTPDGLGTISFYVAAGTYTVQTYGASLSHPLIQQDISIGAGGIADPIMWSGPYNSSTAYQKNDVVSYGGSSWISILSSTNHTPITGTYWQLLAQAGSSGGGGTAGIQGIQGLQGPIGLTGLSGSSGATGQGFTYRAVYSATTTYAVYDVVTYSGSSYVCIGAGSAHQPDTSPLFWTLMVSIGGTGIAGPVGPTGPATITTGSTTTGSPGSSATVTNVGTSSAMILNFVVPSGLTGATGPGAAWGSITGTLSSQTDLEAALTAQKPIRTVTANDTATNADYTILCDATSGVITETLPASPITGAIMNIKKIDSSSNAVTVSGNGKNVEGASTAVLTIQGMSITIQYNTAWWVI